METSSVCAHWFTNKALVSVSRLDFPIIDTGKGLLLTVSDNMIGESSFHDLFELFKLTGSLFLLLKAATCLRSSSSAPAGTASCKNNKRDIELGNISVKHKMCIKLSNT